MAGIMRYVQFSTGPWAPQSRAQRVISRVLGLVIPKANPDFESSYERVTHFWLELNDAGEVLREIAFDPDGQPIAAAPLGENHGIFTDHLTAPAPLGADVDRSAFEQAWLALQQRTGL